MYTTFFNCVLNISVCFSPGVKNRNGLQALETPTENTLYVIITMVGLHLVFQSA